MERLKDKTFSVNTFGCRTNQYEAEAITFALEEAGAVYKEEEPDILIVVSCTITEAAERKCRKLIRKRLRERSSTLVVVCGCYAQKINEKERRKIGIDILVGSRMKHRLPDILADYFEFPERSTHYLLSEESLLKEKSWDLLKLDKPHHRTRAFLKVQDGCNHFCSYCVVPYVRGYPVSRNLAETVEEAAKIVESGCNEIVLTGVHLGLYEGLDILVRRIGEIPGLKRLRFGSIEPFAITDVLLKTLAETEVFCHHLHLPLQSGDDKVLKTMRRGYSTDEYRKIVEKIRNIFGEKIHISTDLMLGFPCEDDRAFRNSMNFLEEIQFGKVHVFPYSRRIGTKAAELPLISQDIIKERKEEALSLSGELLKKYCLKWIGEKTSILVEERKTSLVSGLTPTFIRLYKKDNSENILDIVEVTPREYKNGALYAD
ncbi:MAG: MiaB/RimO family radical SAM methylthiotransferase [Synergistaceae bacterium]